ncbi:MAG: SWIM zinc finger family protein [Acidimicrobiales bacterium]
MSAFSRRRSGQNRGDHWWPESAARRPGKGPKRAQGRRGFGSTWWGTAWVDALEQRARLDPNRLPRGRTYARTGAVEGIEVLVGEVLASVQGSRAKPYDVRVRVRTFTVDEWDRVLDALAEQIGHSAALMDGELPPEVADDVRSVGLDLLPGAGEVQPRCSCPDWADPCKHSAAVCYLVADELDKDPFVLFLLRGRDRKELLSGLRARRGQLRETESVGKAPSDWGVDDGILAREAWERESVPFPSVPLPPRRPGRPTVLAVDPPEWSGLQAETLQGLAADAASRAWLLAVGQRSTVSDLSLDEDFARRAAELLDVPEGTTMRGGNARGGVQLEDLARAAGITQRDLLRRALAWQAGGAGGLAALVDTWDAMPAELEAGRAFLGSGTRARKNRLTNGDRQLRLGKDGKWYPFRKARGADWDPDGPPMELNGLSDPPG